MLPPAQLIKSYGLHAHSYADDFQLYVTLKRTYDSAAVQHQVKKPWAMFVWYQHMDSPKQAPRNN